MLQFLLTNLLLISVGVILYVSVRTLPRIDDSGATEKKGILDRWIASEIPERIDVALNNFLFKFLKRLRVALLKADNSVGERLKKIKPENGANNKASAIDFKEISGQNKEETSSKGN